MASVHKLYIDSRARKVGTNSDFEWQPDRPMLINKCRAFVDSCHIPNLFPTFTETNRYLYVSEERPDFTVLANQNKIYLQETIGSTVTQRIVTLTPGVYNTEALLATELQTQLGNYTVILQRVNYKSHHQELQDGKFSRDLNCKH